ncbi:MAG: hypothetical protein M1376_12540 [Planctomycetes bacterium]|nr:hypothetical protein [Planctomycetota bacterium]
MAKRRKKTRVREDDGHGAAGENPQPDQARPDHNANEPRDLPQEASLEEQGPGEPAPAQDSSAESLTIPLPGEFYQRADRWWWRVKLPGEDKAKARPLKLDGDKAAADDRETAARIAFEMWEHAIQENALRQIRWESTEKIERLKAQFLDKVRHFTELVETANAKIEAEAKARAGAEAKLAQMTQGGQASTPKVEAEEQPALQDEVQPGEPESTAPAVADPPLEVGVCECCEASGIALASLKRIDSGQLLCPHCLAALRADAVRIEPAPAD